MIEQIKQRWYKDPTLLVSYEAVAKQAKPDIEYLLGEVERLEGVAKEGWDIANELSHQVSGQQEEIEELQKALERIKAEDETPTRYFSYEMFYQAVMLVVDEALERTKP